jgi:hypothetical protein
MRKFNIVMLEESKINRVVDSYENDTRLLLVAMYV